ncbi:hypothetical protein LQK93_03483 [Terrabacter sp. BE26]
MSYIVTVHCPLCGAAETAQVRVSSYRKARKRGGFKVTFKKAHVAHVCPNALADATSANSRRDDISAEPPDVRREG